MVFQATTWFVAFATLVGPALCCCTATKLASNVSTLFGGGEVQCPSTGCCHHRAASRSSSSHGSACGHHQHEPKSLAAAELAKRKVPVKPGNPPPRECPCKQHRADVAALPATADAVAACSLGQFAWVGTTADLGVVSESSLNGAGVAGNCRPESACLSGREILRAHSILRI